ncbi:MAG: methylated-DNA--[protein]-cysteine S-methyltransferase [Gammaproteobacteria bacterium]|nr:methylated-DNA--[protein]-cysteine S-methyltransferase [Gammaproteobacteria bacterium]
MNDYDRIARAIDYIVRHVREQPSLEEIAAQVHSSPHHFQRVFTRWAGISPKRFLQHLTVNRARQLLDLAHSNLAASEELGLSSSARLHDHLVSLVGVTPGEYKSGGEGLAIRYGVHPSPFGAVFIACTDRGICQMSFLDDDKDLPLADLRHQWPNATLQESFRETEKLVASIFRGLVPGTPLSLHIRGTNFQVNVWQALLQVPAGQVTTYGELARNLGKPGAARAVGRAVGSNPVAWLIPCHRVIRASGAIGDYRWGQTRKQIMLALENAAAAS